MEKFLNNNWDELGKKVLEYVPNEFSSDDWLEMEKMLEDVPVKNGFTINSSMLVKGLAFLFVFSIVTYFLFLHKKNEIENEVGNVTSEEIIELDNLLSSRKT